MSNTNSIFNKDETLNVLAKFKQRVLEKNPDAFREHGFKKGEILSDFQSSEPVYVVLKVLAVSKYSVLVKDLTFKSIPFTLQKKSWNNLKPMTNDDISKWKSERRRSKVWHFGMKTFRLVHTKLSIGHTRTPSHLIDYVGNFNAFLVTYCARKQMQVYSPNEDNLFEGLFAHGPIYPGQKI